MTVHDPVVIVGFARTPMGGFQGDLKSVTAPALGAIAARGAMQRAGITPGDVDEVLLGCVLPAGQGQAPARQASMGAGIPQSIGATTVNKMCGSGMKTVMLAHDAIMAGSIGVGLAGGMDLPSSVAPFILRGVSLLGVDSVMAPKALRLEAWRRLATELDHEKLASLSTTIGFDGILAAARDIVEGKIRGRVVADM